MAFWNKWRKDQSISKTSEAWVELDIPQETESEQEAICDESVEISEYNEAPQAKEQTIDSRLFTALAGRCSPLEAEAAVSAFIDLGWDAIASEVESMALGRRAVLPSCFQAVLAAYPGETAAALWDKREEIPWILRLCFYSTVQCDREIVAEDVLTHWDDLPKEGMSQAFRLLGTLKTPNALAKLGSFLEEKDWTIAMKAAVAFETADAVEYLPKMREIADAADDVLRASFLEIIHRMEN